MMKFEIVANPARRAVRKELHELREGTEIFSKRPDYYTFQNEHKFEFVFLTGLEIKSPVPLLPVPGVAYFQPGIAFGHKDLAKRLRELQANSYFPNGRPKEKWEPPNFLHGYGLRLRKQTMFGELAPLVEAAKEEFLHFIELMNVFREIDGPERLLQHLKDANGVFGPAGLVFEMFLDHLILNKATFVEKYEGVEFAPIHDEFYQAVVAKYDQGY